jgi:hypothetical protein
MHNRSPVKVKATQNPITEVCKSTVTPPPTVFDMLWYFYIVQYILFSHLLGPEKAIVYSLILARILRNVRLRILGYEEMILLVVPEQRVFLLSNLNRRSTVL